MEVKPGKQPTVLRRDIPEASIVLKQVRTRLSLTCLCQRQFILFPVRAARALFLHELLTTA